MGLRNGILSKKKINDLLTYGFGQAISLLSPLIVMPYLIVICGEEGLGRIGVGFSMALILCGIVDYGSYIKGVKDIAVNRENLPYVRDKVRAIYISKFLLLLAVLAIVVPIICFVPFFARDKDLFFLSLTIVAGQCLNPAWFFQATENFKWIAAINIVSKVIYVGAVFLLITEKADYILANLFFGIGMIVANAIALSFMVKRFKISFAKFSIAPSLLIIKEEFTFTTSQFFLSVYQFFPIMIISYFGGDLMAGQYRVIDQVVSVFKSYLNLFFYFVYGNICYELDKNHSHGMRTWKYYNGGNFVFLAVILLLFFFNAELIFMYFRIEASRIPLISGFFRLALLIPLLTAISQPLRQLMFAFERNGIYITITIVSTIANIILLVMMTRIYGLEGALYSIIFIEVIIIVLYVTVLKKYVARRKDEASHIL